MIQADFDPSKVESITKDPDFIVPGSSKHSQYIVAMHEAFYQWVGRWVKDKMALDAGCGEGFGVGILAQHARKVVGIDIRPELVEHARQRYGSESVEFRTMDCTEMTFPESSFDVVVCDELLEHLEDYRAFVRGAIAVLRPGGLFIAATTNAELTFRKEDGTPRNPQHFQEFTPDEFRRELESYFVDVRLYGERMNDEAENYFLNSRARKVEEFLLKYRIKSRIPIRFRNLVREKITGASVEKLIASGFEIVEEKTEGAVYIIGCGTKSASRVD